MGLIMRDVIELHADTAARFLEADSRLPAVLVDDT